MRRVIRWFSVIVLLLGGCAGYLFSQYQAFLHAPASNSQDIIFEVKQGESLGQVATKLRALGLIDDVRWFKVLAYQQDSQSKIKAGEYTIPPEQLPPALLALLVRGVTRQYSITFVEGWSFKQLLMALQSHPNIQQQVSGLLDKDIMQRLGHPEQHPEGLFFPETYFFDNHAADIDILQRAYQKMQQVLAEEWAAREPSSVLVAPYDALILASIVEKETGLPSERPTIAGVFTRRLKKGMLLQTDPTVIYGIGEHYNGNITRKHLRTDTPYNTYTRKGLTPTPIAMPGREAIHAALHPAAGEALYFVAKGKGDGSHVFSATLREHVNAVNRYQRR